MNHLFMFHLFCHLIGFPEGQIKTQICTKCQSKPDREP